MRSDAGVSTARNAPDTGNVPKTAWACAAQCTEVTSIKRMVACMAMHPRAPSALHHHRAEAAVSCRSNVHACRSVVHRKSVLADALVINQEEQAEYARVRPPRCPNCTNVQPKRHSDHGTPQTSAACAHLARRSREQSITDPCLRGAQVGQGGSVGTSNTFEERLERSVRR
jgi:hypothetical protein